MATKTIGTAARQYSTVAAWIVYLDALTFTENEIGEMYNDSTFTDQPYFNKSNISNGGNTVHLAAASGESFADHADKLTNALYPAVANGVLMLRTSSSGSILRADIANFEMDRIQFVNTTTYGNCLRTDSSTFTGTISQNIFLIQNSDSYACNVRNTFFENNLVIADGRSGCFGVRCIYGNTTVNGCTIVRTDTATGIGLDSGGSGTRTWTNNAVFGFSTNWDAAGWSGSYNASDSTIPQGTNNQESLTYADQFEDITHNADYTASSADLRAKSSGTLNGNGNSATLPTLDILDQTRANDYIGAHEVAGAPPSGRIMSSLAGSGGLAYKGGIAGPGGGLAG